MSIMFVTEVNRDIAVKQASADFLSQSDEEIRRQVDDKMSERVSVARFAERERIALACRVLADRGHASSLAGQITVRTAARDALWTTSLDAGFSEASAGNLLRVDPEMRVLEGSGMPNPALRFHMWIYNARSEINCIVHTHPPYCSALSMIGEPLVVAHMDATMFHEDCAWLPEWPGVPIANEEGRIITQALGQKRAILLAHHGMLTVGRDLEEAVYLAVMLEQAAHLQLLARSAGTIRPIPSELAASAHDFMLKERMMRGAFEQWARGAARRHPDALAE